MSLSEGKKATFEATDVLDAVFGPVNVGTVLRLNVRRIEPFEPLAALEGGAGIRRVAHVTLDGGG